MARQRVARALAGAVEQHHQRHALLQRDAREAQPFRVGGEADRAALHREVLGADHHRPTVDARQPADQRVGRRGRDVPVLHAAGQRAEFDETAFVAQRGDLFAGVQSAGGRELRQPRLAAHRVRPRHTLAELREQRAPVLGNAVFVHQSIPCAARNAWRTSFFSTLWVALRGSGSAVKST